MEYFNMEYMLHLILTYVSIIKHMFKIIDFNLSNESIFSLNKEQI